MYDVCAYIPPRAYVHNPKTQNPTHMVEFVRKPLKRASRHQLCGARLGTAYIASACWVSSCGKYLYAKYTNKQRSATIRRPGARTRDMWWMYAAHAIHAPWKSKSSHSVAARGRFPPQFHSRYDREQSRDAREYSVLTAVHRELKCIQLRG